MSEIRQIAPGHWVGPEDFGYIPHFYTTAHAAKNYPLGSFLQIEPLQPGNKRVDLAYTRKDAESMGEYFDAYSAGGHKDYLDMRIQSVHGRGTGLCFSVCFGLIWLIVKVWMVLDAGDTWAPNYLDVSVVFLLSLVTFIDIFKPIANPVRFHKENQEVYVYHKGILYRIPWNECEMAVIVAKTHMGYGHLKDGYELDLWLNPKHAVNADLSGRKHVRLPLLNNMGSHVPVYGYWEYVRRYMTGDTPFWMEVSEKPRICGFNYDIAREKGLPRAIIGFLIAFPLLFLFRPELWALMVNPFKRKWPEQVHEWTGERCNWH